MAIKNINPSKLRKTILVAPLDWGLGHTTRCIPLISKLLEKRHHVILAGDKAQEVLLTTEFPGIPFLPLKGYNIKYGTSGKKTVLQLLWQAPGILKSAKKENEWLGSVIKKYSIDAVLSDNRFGLYSSQIPSVFITHQLYIASPLGAITAQWVQKRNYSFINKFSECWVPDFPEANSLAGKLSHPEKKPSIPVKYIGPLSRFRFENNQQQNGLLVILSGPEPQRSIFETIILRELENYNGKATVIRGLPGAGSFIPSVPNVTFYNHLPAKEMEREINKSSMVIGRCGYSTVMDMAVLKKSCVLVPTPGQTEQLYLARHLTENNIAACIHQENFSLRKAIELAHQFSGNFAVRDTSAVLDNAVDSFLSAI